MKNVIKMSLAAAVMMTVGTVSAQADEGINIFSNVKVNAEIRARYENVDTDNTVNDANALTNRLVIGVGADLFETDWLSGYAEMTDVHNLNDNYNSTDNNGGSGNVNTVADPEQTRVTQAYIDLKYGKTKLRSGRQLMNWDNQRFVGAVGWRQMPQTFDAFTLTDNTIEGLNLTASYVYQQNRVFAGDVDTATARKRDSESVLLNAKYKVMDALTVTAYGYLISDRQENRVAAMSSDTYGIALTGSPKISDDLTINYRAEYAIQTDATMDAGDTTSAAEDHDSEYINLEVGVNMSGFLAGVNYELLGADDDRVSKGRGAFATPYATAHAFNGWADMFLATPATGLQDLNVMLGYKSKDIGLFKVIYHDFSSDDLSIDYGQELDILYTRAIPGVKGLTGMLKFADYQGDDSAASGNNYATDTQKFWAMLDFKFSN